MQNNSLSYQLGNWPETNDFVGNDNITFGGNVESAFSGHLKFNLIYADSPWLFNVNY
jgi:hypothetical protein